MGSGGSSPLARGLRGIGVLDVEVAGIIPARAGFTSDLLDGVAVAEDHPRSRGVYYGIRCVRTYVVGSSPLARGLLFPLLSRGISTRIIPARAGFTAIRTTTPSPRADHPRSRGVYGDKIMTMLRTQGSSPLARGLRASGESACGQERIIPARAGFTARNKSWP